MTRHFCPGNLIYYSLYLICFLGARLLTKESKLAATGAIAVYRVSESVTSLDQLTQAALSLLDAAVVKGEHNGCIIDITTTARKQNVVFRGVLSGYLFLPCRNCHG